MGFKDFHYIDVDGDHFPDTHLGSNLFYGLDFSCYLNNEKDTIDSIVWNLPDGIESEEDFLDGNVGVVKLRPTHTGSFRINCILTSSETKNEATLSQDKSINIVLKVY